MNRKVRLAFITQNQKSKEKAERISNLLAKALGIDNNAIIGKYDKFENSYKIAYEFEIEEKTNLTHRMIELTDRICSPWIAYYDRDSDKIELIFNKTDFSTIRNTEFNVINWAGLNIDDE